MSSNKNCPICGNQANSPHHVCPREDNGPDTPRNIVWLCKGCHDVVEAMQEYKGVELSPDLLNIIRAHRRIKLDGDSDVTMSFSYIKDDDNISHCRLNWVVIPGGTKKIINQFMDGYIPLAQIQRPANYSIVVTNNSNRNRKKPGPKGKVHIDTSYIEELAYNKGLSYRGISSVLRQQGFILSHMAIKNRLAKGHRHVTQEFAICKYKKCGQEFTPKGTRRVYCSEYCCLADNRMLKKLSRRTIDDRHPKRH